MHLEVEMWPGRVASRPGGGDDLTLGHTLAARHNDDAVVGIVTDPAIAVIDHNEIAVARIIPTRIGDRTAIDGIDCVAGMSSQVDTRVPWREVVAGDPVLGDWPNERAGSHHTGCSTLAETGISRNVTERR